ncbi:hypothetical protein PFISCL1PPCAC_3200, partial [Pristionchus fissidentatus]
NSLSSRSFIPCLSSASACASTEPGSILSFVALATRAPIGNPISICRFAFSDNIFNTSNGLADSIFVLRSVVKALYALISDSASDSSGGTNAASRKSSEIIADLEKWS